MTEQLGADQQGGAARGAQEPERAPAPGDSVLSINPIYRHHGIGKVVKVKDEQAKVEFSPSVFSLPPYRSVNWILRLKELEILVPPLDAARLGLWDAAWRFDLRQMSARLLAGNKGGQLGNARTEILPHQVFTAHAVVKSPRRRFLLADEVGLGKTIEAGMVWQALQQRGQARRTSIVCPAGLTTQWREEMQEKFGAEFEVFGQDFTAVNPRVWDLKAQAIASLQTLRLKHHKEMLLENRRWDLIIFDEAQHLSARRYGDQLEKTKAYQFADELKRYTDALLLLSATPHQGEADHSRFRNLLLLLADRVDFSGLDGRGLFRNETAIPYQELVLRTPKKHVTDAQGRTVFKGRKTWPIREPLFTDGEAAFYGAVEDYIREGYAALERVQDVDRRRAIGYVLTVFQRLNASSVAAVKSALRTRRERLREKLVATLRDAGDTSGFDERFQGEMDEAQAPVWTTEEILAEEIAWLDRLLAMEIPRERKAHELRRLLGAIDRESPRGVKEKVLVFTEYRKTQEFLVRDLETAYGRGTVAIIHGGQDLGAKREAQRAFRDGERVRFLVSTEAGGEGINLQFCHILVNYDLPWNPMRVEQRVGRIYRFGQDKVVQVYNFSNRGTIEEKVRSYFENRIRRAAQALCGVTGEDPEEVCASLGVQLDCEIRPDEIYRRALVERDLYPQTKKDIVEAVERARRAYEIATTSLFRDVSAYSFEHYRRELASDLGLEDLRRFTEQFLRRHGREPQWQDRRLRFRTPDALLELGLPARMEGITFDRNTAIRHPSAEFFALGHEFVDAMLRFVGDPGFGGYATRRIVRAPALAMKRGLQFNFLARSQVPRADGDEFLFDFHCIVLGQDYCPDEALTRVAAASWSEADAPDIPSADWDWARAHQAARRCLEARIANLWDWDEEVSLLGVAELLVG